MKFQQSQQLKLGQSLVMTPQLQQAIKLLQLSRQELEQLIQQNLVENPVLENADSEDFEAEEPEVADSQTEHEDEWQEYTVDNQTEIKISNVDAEQKLDPVETRSTKPESLVEHLLRQLNVSSLTVHDQKITHWMVFNLNEDGYLNNSLRGMLQESTELSTWVQQKIAEEEPILDSQSRTAERFDSCFGAQKQNPDTSTQLPTNQQCAALELCLKQVQQLTPTGVASRSLQECLLLQLEPKKESLAYKILKNDLKTLEKQDLKAIAKHHKVSLEQVQAACQQIASLEPKPGRNFFAEITQYVVPDIYITQQGNDFRIQLNEQGLSKLRISANYQKLYQQRLKAQSKKISEQDELANQYLNEKIKAGEWLIKSIEQRDSTVYKVAESILKHQKQFFVNGPDSIQPLVLKTVAEDVGIHESTVSRITNNKHMHTPQGIFAFKFFFTSGVLQQDGQFVSSKRIKDQIQKLVTLENSQKPYTDQQIMQALEKQLELKVARRTIAKYREALHILPANKRRKMF